MKKKTKNIGFTSLLCFIMAILLFVLTTFLAVIINLVLNSIPFDMSLFYVYEGYHIRFTTLGMIVRFLFYFFEIIIPILLIIVSFILLIIFILLLYNDSKDT